MLYFTLQIMETEYTLVILKPDTLLRGLVGKVISKFEEVGLKLVGCKMLKANPQVINKMYNIEDRNWVETLGNKTIEPFKEQNLDLIKLLGTDDPYEFGLKIAEQLKEYMQMGPVVAMVWEGANAVKIVRKVRGSTVPLTAEIGSILGDFSHDSTFTAPLKNRSLRNIAHASGSLEEAKYEIKLWFGDGYAPMEYDRTDALFF